MPDALPFFRSAFASSLLTHSSSASCRPFHAGTKLTKCCLAPPPVRRTLLRLATQSNKCNRATANFTGNDSADATLCCTFLVSRTTPPAPGSTASFTSCQLPYESILEPLFSSFIQTCPGSLAEAYISCELAQEDLDYAADWSFDPISGQDLRRAACDAKPKDGMGLQGQGCRLVPSGLTGDLQPGSFCLPAAWSSETIASVVQLLTAKKPSATVQDVEAFTGSCGRDLTSKVGARVCACSYLRLAGGLAVGGWLRLAACASACVPSACGAT